MIDVKLHDGQTVLVRARTGATVVRTEAVAEGRVEVDYDARGGLVQVRVFEAEDLRIREADGRPGPGEV